MKLDRLLGILTVLNQNKKTTAPELAARFEVSRRTIQRDIETLCGAGFPIVTEQGTHGGISLMEGFSLPSTPLTRDELSAIFTGLRSLESVSLPEAPSAFSGFLQKIGMPQSDDWMQIDLASFYKGSIAAKIELFRQAIHEHRQVTFHYFYPKGEAEKRIEPYHVVFQWSDWYIFGFCTERQDFRLYKLRRLWNLQKTDTEFSPREIPEDRKTFGQNMTDDYFITAIYASSVKYRLVEQYGPDSFTEQEDGLLCTCWGFTSPDDAVLHFLSFGDAVTVTDPPEIVEKMRTIAQRLAQKYSET